MSTVLTFNEQRVIPKVVRDRLPTGRIPLRWTWHALCKARDLDFKVAHDDVEFYRGRVVEVETDARMRPTKVVFRMAEDNRRDMVMAIVRDHNGSWVVVTCWANKNSDHHTSLKSDRVVSAPVRC